MGHYEEQYAEDDHKAAERMEAKRVKLMGYISRDIQNRSIEAVLTDIVMDPQNYRNRSR